MLRGLNSPIQWCVLPTAKAISMPCKYTQIHTRHGASALETTTFLKIFILFYFILFFTQIFCLPFIFLSFSVSGQLAYVCCACHSPSQSRMALYYCCLQRSCMYGSFVIIELLLPQGEESARTLGVLDVDEQKERSNVKNTVTGPKPNGQGETCTITSYRERTHVSLSFLCCTAHCSPPRGARQRCCIRSCRFVSLRRCIHFLRFYFLSFRIFRHLFVFSYYIRLT